MTDLRAYYPSDDAPIVADYALPLRTIKRKALLAYQLAEDGLYESAIGQLEQLDTLVREAMQGIETARGKRR